MIPDIVTVTVSATMDLPKDKKIDINAIYDQVEIADEVSRICGAIINRGGIAITRGRISNKAKKMKRKETMRNMVMLWVNLSRGTEKAVAIKVFTDGKLGLTGPVGSDAEIQEAIQVVLDELAIGHYVRTNGGIGEHFVPSNVTFSLSMVNAKHKLRLAGEPFAIDLYRMRDVVTEYPSAYAPRRYPGFRIDLTEDRESKGACKISIFATGEVTISVSARWENVLICRKYLDDFVAERGHLVAKCCVSLDDIPDAIDM